MHYRREKENKEKFKLPIDEKLVKMFKGRRKWSLKTKNIFKYSIDNADNDMFYLEIEEYFSEFHPALYSEFYKELSNNEYEEIFFKYLRPNDVADLIEWYIENNGSFLDFFEMVLWKHYDLLKKLEKLGFVNLSTLQNYVCEETRITRNEFEDYIYFLKERNRLSISRMPGREIQKIKLME